MPLEAAPSPGVHPTMASSWLCSAFSLSHSLLRPFSYKDPRRFSTTPSQPERAASARRSSTRPSSSSLTRRFAAVLEKRLRKRSRRCSIGRERKSSPSSRSTSKAKRMASSLRPC